MNGPDCANCGARLAGPWCSQCGQHAHDSARGFGALLHDAWHSLTHLDGRFARTLHLLFRRPGALTAEYFANRRERYVPPFRLYLVSSVVFFALASLTAGQAGPGEPVIRLEPGENPAVACHDLRWNGGPPPTWLHEACLRITRDDGEGLGRAFLANAPKMMFLALPVLAALMLPFWWRPRRLYVEHLVFALHTHAFLFSAFALLLLLGTLGAAVAMLQAATGLLSAVLCLWILAYPWLAMRRRYGDSRLVTTAKFTGLFILYAGLLTVSLLGTVIVSAFAL